MEDNPDYISVWPAITRKGSTYCAVVRKYDKMTDDYISTECSHPMTLDKAQALAQSWARALSIEVR